jgi:hypothetical protein
MIHGAGDFKNCARRNAGHHRPRHAAGEKGPREGIGGDSPQRNQNHIVVEPQRQKIVEWDEHQ